MAYAELEFPHITSIASPLSGDLRIFWFDNDGPDYLCINGPRHDNNHVDIQDIQILPTTDEILAVSRLTWMPKENIARLARTSADSQRVAKHLAGPQDSANELQRFPNVLRDNAIVEAFRYVLTVDKASYRLLLLLV
jgi:hypothetical protein